jgi:hypothetical protein
LNAPTAVESARQTGTANHARPHVCDGSRWTARKTLTRFAVGAIDRSSPPWPVRIDGVLAIARMANGAKAIRFSSQLRTATNSGSWTTFATSRITASTPANRKL